MKQIYNKKLVYLCIFILNSICALSYNYNVTQELDPPLEVVVNGSSQQIQIPYQNSSSDFEGVPVTFNFLATQNKLLFKIGELPIHSKHLHCYIFKKEGNHRELYYSVLRTPNVFKVEDLEIGVEYEVVLFQSELNEPILSTVAIEKVKNKILATPGHLAVYPSQYTNEELVNSVLFNTSCVNVTNVSYSSHPDDKQAIAYFEKNGSNFPFEKGVILSTGRAKDAEGPKATSSSLVNNGGVSDADISQILVSQGFNSVTNNTARLEFDFVALTENLSFNFIFASDEYGTFQCDTQYADAFIFLLTDLTTGQSSNLAVIPNTNTPISVYTVKNNVNNTNCPSQNQEYFHAFYQEGDVNAPINFKGVTVPLVAQSEVIPGNSYHIKLAIADNYDTSYDSAVFIEGGSFDANLNLGQDTTLCVGEELELQTGLNVNEWNIKWYLDGNEIEGATANSYTVTAPGTYSAKASFTGGSCELQDEIIVSYHDDVAAKFKQPEDISICGEVTNPIDITSNIDDMLAEGTNKADYEYTYYLSLQDLQNDSNPIATPENYVVPNGKADIFIKVKDKNSGCWIYFKYKAEVNQKNKITDLENVVICEGYILPQLPPEGRYYTGENQTGEELFAGQVLPIGTHKIYIYKKNEQGCIDEGSYIVTVIPCSIPKGVSPNGDGFNDSLDLTDYHVIDIKIYNRYGTLVYEKSDGYTNQWVGQDKDNHGLPSGTYYYQIQTPLKKNIGWIQLNR